MNITETGRYGTVDGLRSLLTGTALLCLVVAAGIGTTAAVGTAFQVSTPAGSNATQNASDRPPMTEAGTQTGAVVETTLEVQGVAEPVSYADPVTVRGTLRTVDGEPVANRQIRLRLENRSRLVTTDATGSFAFEYRPQSTRLGRHPVEIAYVPAQSAPYRGDTATFIADVQQTAPTLMIERTPASVGYGDQLTVTTTVAAGGTGVEAIPVELRINGTLFKQVLTGADGTVTTTLRLPADVPAGERSIVAVIPYEDRAIAGDSTTVPLTIERQPSTLSMNATAENGTIVATGRFATESGQAVRNQPIQVTLTGGEETVVLTDRDGTFRARLSTEAVPADTDTATVTARYVPESSNLGPSNASATVPVTGGGAAAPSAPDVDPSGFVQALLAQIRARLTIPVIAALLTGIGLVVLDITARRLGLFSGGPSEPEATNTSNSEARSQSEADVQGVPPTANEAQSADTPDTADSDETDISRVSAEPTGTDEAGRSAASNGPSHGDDLGILGKPYSSVAEGSDVPGWTDLTEPASQWEGPERTIPETRTVGEHIEAAIADEEYEAAITLAYMAIHNELTESWGLRANTTHWELVEWCREHDFDEDEVDAIKTIVEAFDRATFADTPVEREHAESALESAHRVRLDDL